MKTFEAMIEATIVVLFTVGFLFNIMRVIL